MLFGRPTFRRFQSSLLTSDRESDSDGDAGINKAQEYKSKTAATKNTLCKQNQ